jgi:tight adherence protein B
MWIAGLAFVLVFAVVFVPYWALVARTEEREERALRKRLRVRRTSALGPAIVKAQAQLGSLGHLDAVLMSGRRVVEPLERLIEQSGSKLTLGRVLLACGFMAVVTFILVSSFSGSVVLAIVLAILIGSLPVWYVRWAAQKRLAVFEEQFPEAIDLIARGLRAGHALTTTLQMVGDEIPDPVGTEFRLLFEQQNYGMSLADALKGFAQRVPIIDARFFVTALLTQREMGGNLSEVLDNLAAVIRERFKVKRQVRAVSAHGRITGVVLGFLAPAVALVLFMISPSHMSLLIEDPLGIQMVMVGLVLQMVGVLIIRRIVDVEY